MKTNIRLLIALTVLNIFLLSTSYGLEMDRRQKKAVKNVTMRLLSQLITEKTPITEPATTITVTNRELGHMRVASGKLVVQNLTTQLRNAIADRKISFSRLSRRVKIQANATFLENDIQRFVAYKIKKLHFRNTVFPKVKFNIKNGYIEARGKIVLKRVPGNYLDYFASKPVPFNAKFKFATHKSKFMLKIVDGVVNGQTITEDFKKQVESWINPIWDFKKADFNGSVNSINITEGQISLSGALF